MSYVPVRTIADCHAHTRMHTYVDLSNTFTIHGTRVLTQYRRIVAEKWRSEWRIEWRKVAHSVDVE